MHLPSLSPGPILTPLCNIIFYNVLALCLLQMLLLHLYYVVAPAEAAYKSFLHLDLSFGTDEVNHGHYLNQRAALNNRLITEA